MFHPVQICTGGGRANAALFDSGTRGAELGQALAKSDFPVMRRTVPGDGYWPKAGTPWPEEQRKLWLDTAASIFKMIYKDSADKLPPLPYSK
jgi:hypothetical protein